jgi:hemoglobin-like flavoprotein
MAAAKTPTLPEFNKAAQEQTLAAIRQSQALALEAVNAWAKAYEKTAAQLPAIPAIPGVPTIEEVVASSFDFAGELLATQRKFAEDLVAATAPAVKTKATA